MDAATGGRRAFPGPDRMRAATAHGNQPCPALSYTMKEERA